MQKLKQKDRDELSRILHNNWDNLFELITGSSVNESGVLIKNNTNMN